MSADRDAVPGAGELSEMPVRQLDCSDNGVMPAEELEGDEVVILFEYDPYEGARAVH